MTKAVRLSFNGVEMLPTSQRLFTPAEANALLPLVATHLREARARVAKAREMAVALRDGQVRATTARARITQLKDEAMALLSAIRDEGVEVKGLDDGLLDFPALYRGQQVLLCWQEGEDSVRFWHPLPTGIAGRQPIDPNRPEDWEWLN